MPVHEVKVKEVFRELRAYFKGQSKSSNKRYSPQIQSLPGAVQPELKRGVKHWRIVPDAAHRSMRAERSEKVEIMLNELRDRYMGADKLTIGYHVLDQADRIGNCSEMSAAACYLVVLRQAGTAWFVETDDPYDHAFCIVSSSDWTEKRTFLDLASDRSDAWVLDGWSNVCCPVRRYRNTLIVQLQKWSGQGKLIQFFDPETEKADFVDPASRSYLLNFHDSVELDYEKIDEKKARPPQLPLAIRERKEGIPASAVKARVWGPDSFDE